MKLVIMSNGAETSYEAHRGKKLQYTETQAPVSSGDELQKRAQLIK